ncbi:dynamin GTPase [Aspergillus sclerotiicarbonarius CBS 121057]|uniref:Dynamin GTPase n=1 Tax=Aspergillus sclerotiicarbonarius (strain CBS 121057 / IBT 28362) TaxID=1448318 RepID=A0A319F1X1_ASPSB|nr:dynamin GTPase [Aspergillus sclerotiicarbonarius CBS 121057]
MKSNPAGKPASRPSRGRQRRWVARVKTGCVTCRIRRIKCDEARPSCRNCRSTGRCCDGYNDDTMASEKCDSLIPSRLPSTWDFVSLDSGEKENFFFFRSITTSTLAGFFDLGFWSYRLLQDSHRYPALWHGMTALAGVHREYVDPSKSVTQPRMGDTRNVQLALKQFNKSIESLMNQFSGQSLTIHDKIAVLSTCVLYICISSLQGRQPQAFMHLLNGLKLFHQWDLQSSHARSPEDWLGAEMLLLIFTRLDSQARPYLAMQDMSSGWTDTQLVQPSKERPFATLLESYISLEALFNDVIRFFLRYLKNHSPNPDPIPSGVREMYFRQVQEWDVRHATLLRMSPEYLQEKAIDLLNIRRQFVGVMLALDPTQGDLAHDELFPEYAIMVDTVARILEGGDERNTPDYLSVNKQHKHPAFSLETGIVEPLFWIGTRCREPFLRRKALDLLKRYPRREGICEGMLASCIVERVIEIEENGCPQANAKVGSTSTYTRGRWICKAHRVATWDFILVTERQVRVVMKTVEDWELSRGGIEVMASWW